MLRFAFATLALTATTPVHAEEERSVSLEVSLGGSQTTGDLNAGGMRAAAQLGIYLQPNLVLEGEVAGVTGLVNGYGATTGTVGVRWIGAELFQVRAGVGVRNSVQTFGLGEVFAGAVVGAFGGEVQVDELDVTDLGLSASLASRAHFGAFTLSAEWLGLYQPVATLESTEQVRTWSPADGRTADAERRETKRDGGFELRFLVVGLGLAF